MIKKFDFKIKSEENFMKHAVETNKKSQKIFKPKTANITEEMKKAKILNKNLKTVLSNEKIQNDNMLQAIKTLLNDINDEIYFDFEETLKKYDNEYFVDKVKNMKDYKIIDELLGKVEQLEKEKFAKDIEIKNLKSSRPDKACLFKK